LRERSETTTTLGIPKAKDPALHLGVRGCEEP
jgi:hypothetical protein